MHSSLVPFWFYKRGKDKDVVLGSKILVIRNVRDYLFPEKMTIKEGIEFKEKLWAILKEKYPKARLISSNSLTAEDIAFIKDWGLVSKNFLSSPKNGIIILDRRLVVIVNDENHIKIIRFLPTLPSKDDIDLVWEVEEYIDDYFDIAFSDKYGYISSTINFMGTGFVVEMFLHFIGFVLEGSVDHLLNAGKFLDFIVSGFLSLRSIYAVSNAITLGKTEEEILQEITSFADVVIKKEREIRYRLYEVDRVYIEDKIYRSIAVLRSARLLSLIEANDLMTYTKLGIFYGLLSDVSYERLHKAYVRMLPYFIGRIGDRDMDVKRANIIRECIA
jgi:protein arginine kinase